MVSHSEEVLLAALREDMLVGDDGMERAASRLAHVAHCGQTDRAGCAYVDHPARVASRVKEGGGPPEAVAAAWLHDTVEDTWVTPQFLAEAGFPATVLSAVDGVTKREGEPTEAYVRRIVADPLAPMVKRADLADNTDPSRLALLDPSTRRRFETKYAAFTLALDAALA